MNIPPMPEWDENEPCPAYTAQYVIALGNYAVRGWAEAERLEKELEASIKDGKRMYGAVDFEHQVMMIWKDRATRAESQVKELAEALGFYANLSRFRDGEEELDPIGEKARAALSRMESK